MGHNKRDHPFTSNGGNVAPEDSMDLDLNYSLELNIFDCIDHVRLQHHPRIVFKAILVELSFTALPISPYGGCSDLYSSCTSMFSISNIVLPEFCFIRREPTYRLGALPTQYN